MTFDRGVKYLVLVLLFAGCSQRDPSRRETAPARGFVKWNGKPATGARVMFTPTDAKGLKAQGTVGADGGYSLTTYVTGDGAPPGEYLVSIEWTESGTTERQGPDDSDTAKKVDKLRGRYADPAKSGIRRTVKKGEADLEPIDLK